MAHILVIDDDAAALESVTIVLEDSGHSTMTANDGEDGLRLIDRESFDLVITDLIMPGKEGLETLMDIKMSHAPLKVMVMSGGLRDSNRLFLDIAQTMGADCILAKPFTSSELMGQVENVLGQSEASGMR